MRFKQTPEGNWMPVEEDSDMALTELSRQKAIQARQAITAPYVEPHPQPEPEPMGKPEDTEQEQGFETDLTASIGSTPATRGRPKK